MKLNYRDKVILGVVLAIAILLGGYFALIKPKNEEIKSNNKTLEALEKTEREYKQKIAQIDPLKEEIGTIVDDTNKITKHFVPIDDVKGTVKLDRYMQHFAQENNIRVTDLALGDMSEVNLSYYYIDKGSDVGSGLREFADINGSYQKNIDDVNAEKTQLSEREAGGVISTQYGITAKGTVEDLWNFMTAIEEQDKTIIINSVSWTLDDKEDSTDEEKEPVTDADGNVVELPSTADTENLFIYNKESEIEMKLVLSLYSVYDLPQPDVENIE